MYGRAVIGHLLEDDDLKTIIAANDLRIHSQADTSEGQEADHEIIGIDQGGNAMDEGVDTGTSPVNECCNANENRIKTSDQHKNSGATEMKQLRSSNPWIMRIHLR